MPDAWSAPLLVRLDSGHDALETRGTLAAEDNLDFILKWNPRRQNLAAWLAEADLGPVKI